MAREYVVYDRDILDYPLPTALRAHVDRVLEGLHPVAKTVLHRTRGIWFAQNLPGAAAVYLPCDVDPPAVRGGFLLVDMGEFPLDEQLRDVQVPSLYWNSLAGDDSASCKSKFTVEGLDTSVAPAADHAVRYLILHELGHALSVLAGEFELAAGGRTEVRHFDGFAAISWRMVTTQRTDVPSSSESTGRAIVPRVSLDSLAWGSLLDVLRADAALHAPGYAFLRPSDPIVRARSVCAAVDKITEAGFVTPTAARYPTEDYAEMFAHAILADEGKLTPHDSMELELPYCEKKVIRAPYFSSAVTPKRQYMERALGLRPATRIPYR